jgi:hypothetical protein
MYADMTDAEIRKQVAERLGRQPVVCGDGVAEGDAVTAPYAALPPLPADVWREMADDGEEGEDT